MKPVTIIFEDEEIKVLWHPGKSNFLLITFGDLISLADGDSFFADAPVKKLELNCIGIMAKRPNWFPVPNVANAAIAIEEISKRFSQRIIYGGSMGGYAAIKFSRRLKANSTVSLCPQWSLDPSECNGIDSGWQKFYEPYMMDMGITKHDIGGHIYMLYDPSHHPDNFHANKISKLGPNIHPITMRSTNHHITTILAGTKNLDDLITQAAKQDNHMLSVTAGKIRRSHPTRQRILLTKLSIKHPRLLDSIMSGENTKISNDDKKLFNTRILAEYIRTNQHTKASNIINRLSKLDICPTRKTLLEKMQDSFYVPRNKPEKTLITSHGSTLMYSAISATLIHSNVADSLAGAGIAFPVTAISVNDEELICIKAENNYYYLSVRPGGLVELSPTEPPALGRDEFLSVERNIDSVYIKRKSHYISAEKNGSVSYNRSSASSWETFKEPRLTEHSESA